MLSTLFDSAEPWCRIYTEWSQGIWDFRPTYKTGSLVNAIEAEPTKILADQCFGACENLPRPAFQN